MQLIQQSCQFTPAYIKGFPTLRARRKIRYDKDIRAGGRSSITDKFDVYVFNPWTSEFIKKKRMKAIR